MKNEKMTVEEAKGRKAEIHSHLARLNEAISGAVYAGMRVTVSNTEYHIVGHDTLPMVEVDVTIDPYILVREDGKVNP